MTRPVKLGAAEALARLQAGGSKGWREADGRDALTKTFRFGGFAAAFAWMTRIALLAEALDHHPEWFNVYDRVEVALTTHDAAGVTELDLKLAKAMDEAASPGGG